MWDHGLVKGCFKDCTTAHAISASASLVFRHLNNFQRFFLDFACSIVAATDMVKNDLAEPQRHHCLIFLQKDEDQWQVDAAVAEAAVSLSYWSCNVRYHITTTPKRHQYVSDCKIIRRTVAGARQEVARREVVSLVDQIGLWACVPQDELERITYITANQSDAYSGMPHCGL